MVTFVALVGALFTLLDSLGTAAWIGWNVVMWLYVLCSTAAFAGLLLALIAWRSDRAIFIWASGLSAFVIVCEQLLWIWGFVYRRDPSLPLTERMVLFGVVPVPILALYGFILISASAEALRSWLRCNQMKAMRH